MNKLFKDSTTLGVIISRMQVPYLTESHLNMIRTVQNRHSKVLILLGVTADSDISIKNPFSFIFRKQMIQPHLRDNDVIIPLQDDPDNTVWVRLVDTLIKSNLFIGEKATLYGGRDSFIPYYKTNGGNFEVVELLPEDNDSGTELRNLATIELPNYSEETAKAIIYTINKMTLQNAKST